MTMHRETMHEGVGGGGGGDTRKRKQRLGRGWQTRNRLDLNDTEHRTMVLIAEISWHSLWRPAAESPQGSTRVQGRRVAG